MVKKGEGGGKKGVPVEVNRGTWTAEEDQKLVSYVRAHGDKKWRSLPVKAGLNRNGKSCRLRWLNYLRPGIKRGNISEDEEDLIIRLHNLLGNRWSLIAARLPGRTDNEIKNHWNTHLSKRSLTIDDLNKKINLKPDSSNANGLPPCWVAPEYHVTNGVGDCHPSSCLSAELTGSEFNVEQLFNFMLMPSLDPCDVVVSSSSELGMEDFDITDQDSYGALLGAELCGANEERGCLDLQVLRSPSQFDELERIMACQNLHPIFHQ